MTAPAPSRIAASPAWAELHAVSNFSFLEGGSHPDELVARARALGLAALGIADRNTLAGVVRAHTAAKEAGLRLLVGARLDLDDGTRLLCYPTDRRAYGRLCRLLSLGQGRAPKGQCHIDLDDVAAHAEGQVIIVLPPEAWNWREAHGLETGGHGSSPGEKGGAAITGGGRASALGLSPAALWGEAWGGKVAQRVTEGGGGGAADEEQVRLRSSREGGQPHVPSGGTPSRIQPFVLQAGNCEGAASPLDARLRRIKSALAPAARLYLAASWTYRGDDPARLAALALVANRTGVPLVATGDVLYHSPCRRPLQDVLVCIRAGTTIAEAGMRLARNAERHLKTPAEMARLFAGYEAALACSLEIVEACRFSLDELVYEYPDEPVPPGVTPQAHLEVLAREGVHHRFPDGVPDKVAATLEREFALISQLGYAPYFLTVHDIAAFARSRGILAQGRGSAANSVVCYCLGITAVNPTEVDLLFERFVSPERREPPDIDVDFEHERREEVIQYIYARYGRDRAGLAATVISYRARSAVREVGKAMGLSDDTVAALAGMVWGTHSGGGLPEAHIREAGLDPADPWLARTIGLAAELTGFPRHLSQHVGGFVLTRGPLIEVVPVGNAAMADRTFIEWDKNDLAALGLLKVDVLALGMLTCIRKAFDLVARHEGPRMTLAAVPREDGRVYDMLCKADSIGVFQVESRAQMNMLPRLKPRTFYDLVIEVAIVRPGPIQGDMVHPYLRRRSGLEPVVYPSPSPVHGDADELRRILGKTLGVPLFQEQAMRIAMEAARFSDAEVNELRKAMATFRRRGTIGRLEEKMVDAMTGRGYDREFAQRCFNQIKGFGEYGFPESHAASFAHLVYVSSWLKCHHPAAFAAALLNSQPMGFYAPAQIVRDAAEHGVEVRAADVGHSDWDSTLEAACEGGGPALRLGLRQIEGLKQEEVKRIVEVRGTAAFTDTHDLWRRSGVGLATLERLAAGDAMRSLGLDRRQALWEVKGLQGARPLPLFEWSAARQTGPEPVVSLPAMALSEHVVNDYQTLRLSLKAHPMSFLREQLSVRRILPCADLRGMRNGARAAVAGVILVRQRPGSAKGVVFMTIEDETGIANVVVWPKTLERFRREIMTARLMVIHGRIQRHEDIIHVVSARIEDRSELLATLMDDDDVSFRVAIANADEVLRPEPGSARSSPAAGAVMQGRRHPREERIIPRSRDFH